MPVLTDEGEIAPDEGFKFGRGVSASAMMAVMYSAAGVETAVGTSATSSPWPAKW
ncbi:hypothetical protein [Nonomuraea sp. MG754425]|uniref:hypothetical protein n=1 Tax=Nonomuraea sp. MG754425 TaxID=2570319 RepID=UPI001F1F2288|nr:hypothetical protein [Nonomuraea sp. MG754425]